MKLRIFPFADQDTEVSILYYTDVTNQGEIRDRLADLDCAVIRANLIIDLKQLIMAVSKAIYLQREGQMRTRSFYTEILYRISPSTNVQ